MNFEVGDICIITNEGTAQSWLLSEVGKQVRITRTCGGYSMCEKLDGTPFNNPFDRVSKEGDIWNYNLRLASNMFCANCDTRIKVDDDYLCEACRG